MASRFFLQHLVKRPNSFRRVIFQSPKMFSSYPPHEELRMPALSPTMETGNVAKWLFNVGDEIVAGDVYCEVTNPPLVILYCFT